jgi:hypothetical protein
MQWSRMDLIAHVTSLLEQVISSEILPRFGKLHPRDVTAKITVGDPDDIVTTIDHRR